MSGAQENKSNGDTEPTFEELIAEAENAERRAAEEKAKAENLRAAARRVSIGRTEITDRYVTIVTDVVEDSDKLLFTMWRLEQAKAIMNGLQRAFAERGAALRSKQTPLGFGNAK